MSKSLQKIKSQKPITHAEPKNLPQKQSHYPKLHETREVQEFNPAHLPVIAAYKDLNEPLKAQWKQQRQNLIIGLVVFCFMAAFLFWLQDRQTMNTTHAPANVSELNVPDGARVTASRHYQYDKSCYVQANGEKVCVEKTSQR